MSRHTLKALMEILNAALYVIVVFYFFLAVTWGVGSILLVAVSCTPWATNLWGTVRQSYALTWKTYFVSEQHRRFWQVFMLVGSAGFAWTVYEVMGSTKAWAYVACEVVYYAICYYSYTQYKEVA